MSRPGPKSDAHGRLGEDTGRRRRLRPRPLDGSLHLLDYRHAQARLKRELAPIVVAGSSRLLSPVRFRRQHGRRGRRFSTRSWLVDQGSELPQIPFVDRNLGNSDEGSSRYHDVLAGRPRAIRRDLDKLTLRLGWNPDHVRAIDAYRHATSRYYLVGVDAVVDSSLPSTGISKRCAVEVPDDTWADSAPQSCFRSSRRPRVTTVKPVEDAGENDAFAS